MILKTVQKSRPLQKRTAVVLAGIITATAVLCAGCGIQEPEMVFVEGGTFIMGCTPEQGDKCDDDEKPVHEVTVSDFYIQKYETSQELFEAVVGSNPSRFTGDNNLPVERVSWNDVQVFIQKLNAKTGKKYRLPTEAEWEYAARGGNKSNGYKFSGGNIIGDVAWYVYDECSCNDYSCCSGGNSDQKTHLIGAKQANELGIYDMTGNVWEWVSDWYGEYNFGAQTNPTGPSTGSVRIFRGSSWSDFAEYCRISNRNYYYLTGRAQNVGFRLAASPQTGKLNAIMSVFIKTGSGITDFLIGIKSGVTDSKFLKWIVLVINVFVLIYFITAVLDFAEKRMDDFAEMRMDELLEKRILEDFLSSDNFEKPLLSAPSEEHPDNGKGECEYTVVMKYSMWYCLLGLLSCLTATLNCFMGWDWTKVLLLDAGGIVCLTAPFTRKTLLGNENITVKKKIRFMSFTVYDNTILTPWSAVVRVDCVEFLWFRLGFNFHYTEKDGDKNPQSFERGVFIDFTQDNYKEGLEYAVQKLPSDVFTVSARKRLSEMGICHLDW